MVPSRNNKWPILFLSILLRSAEETGSSFSRRPPAKRLNYGKLVIPTPFYFPWEDLVRFCDKLGGRKSPENTVHVSEKKVKLEDGVAESFIGSDSKMQVQCHRRTSVSENVHAMTNQSFCVEVQRCYFFHQALHFYRSCQENSVCFQAESFF